MRSKNMSQLLSPDNPHRRKTPNSHSASKPGSYPPLVPPPLDAPVPQRPSNHGWSNTRPLFPVNTPAPSFERDLGLSGLSRRSYTSAYCCSSWTIACAQYQDALRLPLTSIPKDTIPITHLYSCRLLLSVNPTSTRGVAAQCGCIQVLRELHNDSRYLVNLLNNNEYQNLLVSTGRSDGRELGLKYEPIARWSIIRSEEETSAGIWIWPLALELTTGRVADSRTRPLFSLELSCSPFLVICHS